MYTGAATMENNITVPQITKNRTLIWDPAVPPPGTYPKESKALIQKDTCNPMFTAALFTIAKTWKQPKYPLIDEWIKKI